jgi:hypothetical protein
MKHLYIHLCIIVILFCGCQTRPLKIEPDSNINNMVVLDFTVMKNGKPYYRSIDYIECKNIKKEYSTIRLRRKGKYLYAFNVPPGEYAVVSGEFYREYPNNDGSTQTVQNYYTFFDDITNLGHFVVERNRVIYIGKFRISAYAPPRYKNTGVFFHDITGGDISYKYYCLLISYENMIANKMDTLKEVKEIYKETRWGSLIDGELEILSDEIKR